jgi:hypothetical protein
MRRARRGGGQGGTWTCAGGEMGLGPWCGGSQAARSAWLAALALACSAPEDSSLPVATETGDPVLRGEVVFGFPVDDRSAISTLVGVDHDPTVHDGTLGGLVCTAYDGSPFPACYDEHDGSDFMLDGGFDAMDAGSAGVRAAADGVVVSTEDGHYDRCHADVSDPSGVSCDGNDGIANHVIVEHAGGVQTLYWHLMKDSVLVAVGDVVSCGQALGRIGSSGFSSAPHLHFEVNLADGAVLDPYAGVESQPETWWDDQDGDEGLPGDGCAAGD